MRSAYKNKGPPLYFFQVNSLIWNHFSSHDFNCHSVRVVYGLEKLIFWNMGTAGFNFFWPTWPKLQQVHNFGFFQTFSFLENCFFAFAIFLLSGHHRFGEQYTHFTSFWIFSIFTRWIVFFSSSFFALPIFTLSGHHCLPLSVRTRCFKLWGGFWPKYYNFQSTLAAFGVASGLNIMTFNLH